MPTRISDLKLAFLNVDNRRMDHANDSQDQEPMLWDIFCRVIDNLGDAGVCWRLCSDLVARGHTTRLWIDEPSVLEWMYPGATQGKHRGIQVLDWAESANPEVLATLVPADVWVEGFGCEIAPEFIASHAQLSVARGTKPTKFPVWINLEYLSAEPYVVRTHGLPSLLSSGAAKGSIRHFFYPGFTPQTGGLIREKDLQDRLANFDKSAWLASHGIDCQSGPLLVSLFCYEPPALPRLLEHLANGPHAVQLLVTQGRAQSSVRAAIEHLNASLPSWNKHEALSISYLPYLSQRDFDHLLWSCDLNFVRGEDSLVRGLWAGRPLVWQIYPQSDDAHHGKLDAFLDMLGASESLRQFHRIWNDVIQFPGKLFDWQDLGLWRQTVIETRSRLLRMDDLGTQLIDFAKKKR